MKVNFEKKHLYIIFGILVLLFSSAYVIAQASFTSPAWTPEKQSHGILYTDIITSKSSTALREVNVEADLIAKGAISLGGVKRTSWSSGGSGTTTTGSCVVTSISKGRAYLNSFKSNLLCPTKTSGVNNHFCINPTTYTTFGELIDDWCDISKGPGCNIELGEVLEDNKGTTATGGPGNGPGGYLAEPPGDFRGTIAYRNLIIIPCPSCDSNHGGGADYLQILNPSTGSHSAAGPVSSGDGSVLNTEGCDLREGGPQNAVWSSDGIHNWYLDIGRDGDEQSNRACKITICKR